MKKLPQICPSCSAHLSVKTMYCSACDTSVSGNYTLPQLARLSEEDQQFIVNFVKSSGSLKDMAQQMGLSYPTVRNLLDDIIERIKATEL